MNRPGKREGIMLCYPYDPRRLQKWGNRAFIQFKLNGERCRAICFTDNVKLFSSEGNTIPFLPHINEALLKLGLHGVELDGELYQHGTTLQDIHSIVSRKVNPHIEADIIEYHIFDIVEIIPQHERFLQLRIIEQRIIALGLGEVLKVVRPEEVFSEKEIDQFLDQAISEGYEGFVLRSYDNIYKRKRSTEMMKFKPHQEDVYEIVGTEEEVSIMGTPKNTLGAFVCRDDAGSVFTVGSGITASDRQELWKVREGLKGQYLKVKYQALSPGRGVPLHSVALLVMDLKEVKNGRSGEGDAAIA